MAARFFVLALFCAACATSNSSSQPATAPAKDPTAAPSEDELSQAFDPEREKPKEEVKPPPPPPDPAASFKAALAEAQAAFKAKDLDRARSQVSVAVKESAALDGEARFQAHQLAFKLAAGDATTAEAAATAWRLACGPEKADACRGAALTALASVAKLKDADKQLGKQVKELQDAEVCAAKAEKGAPKNPCEPTAVRVSQRDGDAFISTRVLLGQALREDSEPRQVALLEKTVKSCDKPQCAGLRRKALGKLIAHARAKNDVDGAVKHALEEVKIIAAATPEPLRLYARTPMVDQTCVSYDTAHGAGSCRALEKQVVGFWTFHDYSKTPAGPALSADQVRMVNDHYAPLLQECLADQAKRMIPPDAQRFEVRWLVFNDGRVGEAHLRKDLDQWPLAKCLRAQFSAWRYPRYEGEFQHVQQSFTVTAVEKRQLR
jgi:hypothetical protein